jgi:hypothetical protein
LTVPFRFRGPADSANGGYARGLIADRRLTAGSALLGPGGEVLAVAETGWLTVPRPVPAMTAEGAS